MDVAVASGNRLEEDRLRLGFAAGLIGQQRAEVLPRVCLTRGDRRPKNGLGVGLAVRQVGKKQPERLQRMVLAVGNCLPVVGLGHGVAIHGPDYAAGRAARKATPGGAYDTRPSRAAACGDI